MVVHKLTADELPIHFVVETQWKQLSPKMAISYGRQPR